MLRPRRRRHRSARIAQRRITPMPPPRRRARSARAARTHPRPRRHGPRLDASDALAGSSWPLCSISRRTTHHGCRGARWVGFSVDRAARRLAADGSGRSRALVVREPRALAGGHQVSPSDPASGDILLERPSPGIAILTQPDQPNHDLHLPRRTLRECLAEELRRLDPDVLYGRVITEGWEKLGPPETGE